MKKRKNDPKYIIQARDNKGTRLYWNNEYGWGNKAGAQKFTERNTKTLNLPIKGRWLKAK